MSSFENAWRTLIATAARAPSPHNAQPWKLRIISEIRADLFIDRTRALPDEDTTGCFMICAMGIFCEALKGIAACHGLDLTAEFVEPSFDEELNLFARLSLDDRADVVAPYSEDLYLQRRTSRLPNLKKRIPQEVLSSLTSIQDESEQKLTVVSDPSTIRWMMDLNIRTTFIDMNNGPYRKEFHTWVRTSPRESMKLKDGLDVRCMNLLPIEFWMNANFYWMYRLPIVSNLIKQWYHYRIGHIEHFGIISGRFWDSASASLAGHYLMKLWMAMAEADVVIHPFGNLVTNLATRKTLEEKLGMRDIWLVFRMGYTKQAHGSYRLDVSEIIID